MIAAALIGAALWFACLAVVLRHEAAQLAPRRSGGGDCVVVDLSEAPSAP